MAGSDRLPRSWALSWVTVTSKSEQAKTEAEGSERVLPELGEAQRAFDVGDYARVRELTASLLGDSNEDVRQAAQTLRRRVSVDPFQVGLLVACLAFFVYITWHYVF